MVEEKDNYILVDAGKSCREIESRMEELGKRMENVNAILLTHSHNDHIAGAGIISRKYGIPLYITNEAYSEAKFKLGEIKRKSFSLSKEFRIGSLRIKPIYTSHNVSSCGFVIGKFGIFTDTGIVTKQMELEIPNLNSLLIESNHDIDMLISGNYPSFLKKWILSEQGHLSNIDASTIIQNKGNSLSLVLLGHLSGNNNTLEIASNTFNAIVKRKIEYAVCSREGISGNWKV